MKKLAFTLLSVLSIVTGLYTSSSFANKYDYSMTHLLFKNKTNQALKFEYPIPKYPNVSTVEVQPGKEVKDANNFGTSKNFVVNYMKVFTKDPASGQWVEKLNQPGSWKMDCKSSVSGVETSGTTLLTTTQKTKCIAYAVVVKEDGSTITLDVHVRDK